MQNTRLNNLFGVILTRLGLWLTNPWRRISLSLISFLLGFFLGTGVATTVGQAAGWDIIAAAILLLFTEVASIIVYGRRQRRPTTEEFNRASWLAEIVNSLKIGLSYSLFVEAFKLGS
ncbi:MAG: DUF565 domain-containing protein [Symploca sp. SIO2E6]|nr:DUF565 domain-containing protein [Symploca sp. SIO2E6]